MDFKRIRLAMDHYESVRQRLTFFVRKEADASATPAVIRYRVACDGGCNIHYEASEDKAEAELLAAIRTSRAKVFLLGELEVVKEVMRREIELDDARL